MDCVPGKIKKFDERLYNKYDVPAREIIKQKLGDENVCDNPDIYAEDLLITSPTCKYKFLELQVCTHWTGKQYPYDMPFIYARKATFSCDTLFLILNKYMTRGIIFNRSSLVDKPRRLKKYSRYYVYDVPWNRVLSVELESLDIDMLNMYPKN
jgi:hypothetical protein